MRYPFAGSYRITQSFGKKNAAITHGTHSGTDWALPSGTPVLSVASGTVYQTGLDAQAGLVIKISSGDINHKYYHLSQVLVTKGQKVAEGFKIGASGATGNVTGPHLHLSIEKNGVLVDPVSVINNGGVYQPAPPQPAPAGDLYVIKRGDTFYDLNQKFNYPQGTLERLNSGIDPRKIPIGRSIRIRSAGAPSVPTQRRMYTIKRGDTFWGLENAFQLPHGKLQEFNPTLNPKTLRIGSVIRIG